MEAAFQIASSGGEESAHALFELGPIPITSWMVTMWGIMILLIVLSVFATKNMKMVPKGLQNAMEYVVEGLTGFFAGMMGKERAKRYGPLLITFFIFILISNYSGMLPFSGHLPGLAAPTSVFNVTVGLAIIVFFATHINGFRVNKIHYLKHFVTPFAFLLPLLLIEEVVRPFSLAMRLYGNIYGEEMVVSQLFNLVPLGVPVVMQLLGVLFGLIQAFVFTLLSAIYISQATETSH